MTEPVPPRCATCRFFAPAFQGEPGQCRRHAPATVVSARVLGSVGSFDTVTDWPRTNAVEWCGDHEARQ